MKLVRPAAYTEAQFHVAVAGFLDNRLLPPAWFSTFPAGGGGKMRGTWLKKAGLKDGVPDILLMRPNLNTASAGCFLFGIELKVSGKNATKAQRKCHATLLHAGVSDIAVCHTLEEIKAALNRWQFALRPVSKSSEMLQMAIESYQRIG